MSESRTQLLPRSYMARKASDAAQKVAQSVHSKDNSHWLLEGVIWQHCQSCQNIFYPARPLCPNCLSEHFDWQAGEAGGYLLSLTKLHVSFNGLFTGKTPWKIGLIAHQDGPYLFAFLAEEVEKAGDKVSLFTVPDATGQAVFVAVRPGRTAAKTAADMAAGLAALVD